ncbi:protoporphyrinogen oxidase [Ilumatobacter sp.]|uniref:protoporphyrinogen oxidase n=1 Tax=Ilumatobacter sp. TaxID=1967498 RepID=UPI003B51A88B
MSPRRVAVVGGGITGLAAALEATSLFDHVVVHERAPQVGGRTRAGTFAGVEGVDRGADAFLARVPDAVDLAHRVGLGDDLVHPERVGAAVWYDGLHDIPDGLVLGVPGNPVALARSGLLSARGTARAALEPFLARTSTAPDSIGAFVRSRFGDEVHERLVDALVGSIYATDTDRFSLAEMPQLASLAEHRSVLLAARRVARRTAGTASSSAAPVFATPRGGVGDLAAATARALERAGAEVRTSSAPTVVADGARWRVGDESFDAVVLAVPAGAVAGIVDGPTPAGLSRAETADVALVTIHLPADGWPEGLRGRSGYLVPKPVQRHVTAVSFASQKWSHWRPPSGGELLRVSLGRDGAPVLHLDDDEIVARALDDLAGQVAVHATPLEVRVDRWPGAFAQYRPHHRRWVDAVRIELADGLEVAGASYDGIGIPACVRSGRSAARRAAERIGSLAP